MPVKNKSRNRTPQQMEAIGKAVREKRLKSKQNLHVVPQQKKVGFGELTHDVMEIVDESAKVKEKEVFDKAPATKKKDKM